MPAFTHAQKKLLKMVVKRSLLTAVFIGYMVSVAILLRMYTKSPPHEATSLQPIVSKLSAPEKTKPGLPSHLIIPEIGVSTIIAPAGLTADGAMDIKKDPDNVAWYNLGPRPGETGSAVIAGHYGWENGKGSIFNDLHVLKVGDTLSVNDEKGLVTSFVVRESRSYDPNADASSVFRSNDGKSHLNLITCEGVWSNAEQTYSRRLVVFTDKI